MRLLLLLLPLLAACRYTFLPLDPGKPPPPERPFVVARLLPEGKEARLLLKVERLPRPGYLHLKWFREEALLQEKALFLEGPKPTRPAFPWEAGTTAWWASGREGPSSSWTWAVPPTGPRGGRGPGGR